MRRLGSKFSVFSCALAIANGRSLQTQKFAPLSFQIYEFIFCEWYYLELLKRTDKRIDKTILTKIDVAKGK